MWFLVSYIRLFPQVNLSRYNSEKDTLEMFTKTELIKIENKEAFQLSVRVLSHFVAHIPKTAG